MCGVQAESSETKYYFSFYGVKVQMLHPLLMEAYSIRLVQEQSILMISN